jgi:hypothetical protein
VDQGTSLQRALTISSPRVRRNRPCVVSKVSDASDVVSQLMESDAPIAVLCRVGNGLTISACGDIDFEDVSHAAMVRLLRAHYGRSHTMAFRSHRLADRGSERLIQLKRFGLGCSLPLIGTSAPSPDGIHLAFGGCDGRGRESALRSPCRHECSNVHDSSNECRSH